MKKIFLFMIVFLIFSCNKSKDKDSGVSKGDNEKSVSKGEGKKIGVLVSTLNNPFFVDLVEGIKEEAAKMNFELVVLDSQNDPSKELSNAEDLATQGVKGVLLNPSDSDAAAKSAKVIKDAGIPVVSLDRAVNGTEVNSHIASDNKAGGKMAADYILKLNPNPKIVELEGISGSSASRERGEGFDSSASKFIVSKQVANFDRAQGLSVMENIIQSKIPFDAVFAQNDEMALGALKAISDAGLKDVIVIGFDAIDDAKEAVKQGTLKATIAQKPKMIGSVGLKVLSEILDGIQVNAFYPVELELIEK